MAGRWRMHAHRYPDGDLYNVGDRRFVESHWLPAEKYPIVEVDVAEVDDSDPGASHWGWIRTGDTVPIMIYPRESLFEMCFPYGSQIEGDHGRGRVVRLAVTEADGDS